MSRRQHNGDIIIGFVEYDWNDNAQSINKFNSKKYDSNGILYPGIENLYYLDYHNSPEEDPNEFPWYGSFEIEFLPEASTNPVDFILTYAMIKPGVRAAATGGVAPYSYEWSNGSTESELPNIPSGNYIVTVTDANGSTEEPDPVLFREPEYRVVTFDVLGDVIDEHSITKEEFKDETSFFQTSLGHLEPLRISSDVTVNDKVQVAISLDNGYMTGLVDINSGEYIDHKFHTWVFSRRALSTISLQDCKNVTVGYQNFNSGQGALSYDNSYVYYNCREQDAFVASAHTFRKTELEEFDDFDYRHGDLISTSPAANSTIRLEGAVYITGNITFTNCTLRFAPDARLVIDNSASPSSLLTVTFDGCELDVVSSCVGTMWEGIQVSKYGKVEFLNSTLKNARYGITNVVAEETGSDALPDPANSSYHCTWPDMRYKEGTSGGDIYANASHFENNWVSIFYRGSEKNSQSPMYKVTDCVFIRRLRCAISLYTRKAGVGDLLWTMG